VSKAVLHLLEAVFYMLIAKIMIGSSGELYWRYLDEYRNDAMDRKTN